MRIFFETILHCTVNGLIGAVPAFVVCTFLAFMFCVIFPAPFVDVFTIGVFLSVVIFTIGFVGQIFVEI